MLNKKKPNSLQKLRKSHFKEFLKDITNALDALADSESLHPSFDQILAMFAHEKFGLIHSFRTRNECVREYYEIFFDLYFETWMGQTAFDMRLGLFLVFYIIVDTIPEHLQVKVLVCQKKVSFLNQFLE